MFDLLYCIFFYSNSHGSYCTVSTGPGLNQDRGCPLSSSPVYSFIAFRVFFLRDAEEDFLKGHMFSLLPHTNAHPPLLTALPCTSAGPAGFRYFSSSPSPSWYHGMYRHIVYPSVYKLKLYQYGQGRV